MDPDTALKEIRERVKEIQAIQDSDAVIDPFTYSMKAERLAELIDGLDGWLKRGGRLPASWGR